MTTPKSKRMIANRQNANRSTGPRSASGKARSAQNARRHGLAVDLLSDPTAHAEIGRLADALTPGAADPARRHFARLAAAAQLDVIRIRRVRTSLADELDRALAAVDVPSLDAELHDELKWVEDLAEGARLPIRFERWRLRAVDIPGSIGRLIDRLAALDRYERRALSRRKQAILQITEGAT